MPLTRRALLAGLAGLAAGALVQACGALSRPGPSGGLTSQSDAAAFGTPTPPEFDEPGQAEMVATIVAQQAVTTAVPSYAVFTPVAAPRRAAARVQRGISVLSWRVGQFSSPDADATLENLAALGTQWIAVIVNGYQDAIAHHRVPEPGDVGNRAPLKLVEGGDPVRAHEAQQVAPA